MEQPPTPKLMQTGKVRLQLAVSILLCSTLLYHVRGEASLHPAELDGRVFGDTVTLNFASLEEGQPLDGSAYPGLMESPHLDPDACMVSPVYIASNPGSLLGYRIDRYTASSACLAFPSGFSALSITAVSLYSRLHLTAFPSGACGGRGLATASLPESLPAGLDHTAHSAELQLPQPGPAPGPGGSPTRAAPGGAVARSLLLEQPDSMTLHLHIVNVTFTLPGAPTAQVLPRPDAAPLSDPPREEPRHVALATPHSSPALKDPSAPPETTAYWATSVSTPNEEDGADHGLDRLVGPPSQRVLAVRACRPNPALGWTPAHGGSHSVTTWFNQTPAALGQRVRAVLVYMLSDGSGGGSAGESAGGGAANEAPAIISRVELLVRPAGQEYHLLVPVFRHTDVNATGPGATWRPAQTACPGVRRYRVAPDSARPLLTRQDFLDATVLGARVHLGPARGLGRRGQPPSIAAIGLQLTL